MCSDKSRCCIGGAQRGVAVDTGSGEYAGDIIDLVSVGTDRHGAVGQYPGPATGNWQLAAESGMPVGIVYPREGVPTVLVEVCPVAAGKRQALAQAFVDMVLSAPAQKLFVDEVGLLPLRKDTPVSPNGFIPVDITPIAIDQQFVIRNRNNWNQRWSKEIGPLD